MECDVLVIGSGAGLKIAREAARRGMETVLVEQGPMGGTCLNRGCIPSKMLIHPAHVLTSLRRASEVGVEPGGRPTLHFDQVSRRIADVVTGTSRDIAAGLAREPHLRVVREKAVFTGPRTVVAGGLRIRGRRVFIAVGAVPAIPPIKGLAATPFWTSTEALRATQVPVSIGVIGGGYIACELGFAYAAFGSHVHVYVRSELLRTADRDVRKVFQAAFLEGHHVHAGTEVVEVQHDGRQFLLTCQCRPAARTEVHASETLLVATGVVPATAALGLDAAGVAGREGGWITVDDHLRTSEDATWALGDCTGGYLLRHSANREADYLVRHVLDGDPAALWHGPMPHAIFSEPEIAGLGATEDELMASGTPYVAGRADFGDSNAGVARAVSDGFCKLLVCSRTRQLLGGHMVFPEASNVVHVLAAVMYRRGRLDDLLEMVYIHPALPEVLRDAARDAEQRLKADAGKG